MSTQNQRAMVSKKSSHHPNNADVMFLLKTSFESKLNLIIYPGK